MKNKTHNSSHVNIKNLRFARTTGPCPDCNLTGYTGGNPLNICLLCNGGGWFGYYRIQK